MCVPEIFLNFKMYHSNLSVKNLSRYMKDVKKTKDSMQQMLYVFIALSQIIIVLLISIENNLKF
jgi:hypothetical protein